MGVLLSSVNLAIGTSTQNPPVLTASTSMISSLLRDIGGDQFQILTILPPASCPGHFDLKPADIRLLRGSELVICHPYQDSLQKVLKQHVTEENRWLVLPEKKPLTIPEEYIKSGRFLLSHLVDRFPERALTLKSQWSQREGHIQKLQIELQKKFQDRETNFFPLIVSFHQGEFAEFWGFSVVGKFDEPEWTSMQKLGELIQKGRKTKVRGIVGNLQSGDRQATMLSEKIGAPLVMLSNFPGAEPNTASYAELLRSNSSKLLGMMD